MFSVLMATESDFTQKGYPTIAVIGGTFIFLYTLYYSGTKTGWGGWRNHALWFFFNIWLWIFGLFLVFGPDSLASVSDGSTTANGGLVVGTVGPRCAILGLQLMVQAAIGAFAIFSANAYASLVFALFGIFNELGLIGSLWLFNYNQPIWTVTSTQCQAYFNNGFIIGINRCDDAGYLEVIRTFGTLEIIVNGYLIVVSLLAYATAVPAQLAGAPGAYGAPAAGGVPGAGAGAYNPGPTYGTSTPAPTTTYIPQPVTTTTSPYTTTTTVPPA